MPGRRPRPHEHRPASLFRRARARCRSRFASRHPPHIVLPHAAGRQHEPHSPAARLEARSALDAARMLRRHLSHFVVSPCLGLPQLHRPFATFLATMRAWLSMHPWHRVWPGARSLPQRHRPAARFLAPRSRT